MDLARAIANRFKAARSAGGLSDQELTSTGGTPPAGYWYDELTQTWLPAGIILLPMNKMMSDFLKEQRDGP